MLHSRPVIGECLCAYAFTEFKQFGFAFDGITLTLDIFGEAPPTSGGSNTGNLVSLDWEITEWQALVVTNSFSGILSSGGFHQEILPATDATYIMVATMTFDDGVVVVFRYLIETRIVGVVVCNASVGKGIYLTSLSCDQIDMNAITANAGCGRDFSPSWLNNFGLPMGTGLVYNGEISAGAQLDFGFLGSLDGAEWFDIPDNEAFVIYTMKGNWCEP